MIYNEEQWKVIANAAPHFITAKRDYIRNAPRQMTEDIINVYESATGKRIVHRDLTCAVCVLRIYQIIAYTYFQDLEEREKNKTNNIKKDGEIEGKKQRKKPDAKKQARNQKKKG